MMKSFLITASVALVCGVIGAMGYAYFFGPKSKGSSSEESQGKSDSGSTKDSGPEKKSGSGESKESGKRVERAGVDHELDPRRLVVQRWGYAQAADQGPVAAGRPVA